MRHQRRIGLFSFFLVGTLCVLISDARAASKKKYTGTKSSAKTQAKPADDSTTASDKTPGDKKANGAGSPKQCKTPAASTCAPGKVVLAPPVTSPYANEGFISAMAAADVNGDGKTDLILSHSPGALEVLLSKGDGTFEEGMKVEEQVGGYALVAADFDGDCIPDLLSPSYGGQTTDNSASLHSGKGNGSFRSGMATALNQNSLVKLIPADFNADGWLDFAYISNNSDRPDGPTLVLNLGKGRFAGPGVIQKSERVFTMGDVTGDGAAEIVAATNNPDASSLCVHVNNGHAQFAQPVCHPVSPNTLPNELRVVDLNGDGKMDIVLEGQNLNSPSGVMFNIFLNQGDGTFEDHESYSLESNKPTAMTVADLNNDGRPDLVVYTGPNQPTLFVLKNKGDGTFTRKPEKYDFGVETSGSDELLVSGDFKGNGLQGLAGLDASHNAVSVITADCKP